MTSPIQYQHAIASSLQRYTNVPAAKPDPGAPVDPPPPAGGAAGAITLSGRAVGTAPSVATATVFGYNFNDDTPLHTIAGRKSLFGGRNPCPRVYTGATGHPSTFSWGVGADEHRMCWSFKADKQGVRPTHTAAWLASSAAVPTYVSWLEGITAGGEVFWCYHHEPNSSGGLEVPAATFTATYDRMREAKNQASLKPGVKVHITANFMAYQVGTANWSNAWIPDCDILTWDSYGNPGQNTSATGTNKYGTATGSAYGTTYPLVTERYKAMFAATKATGHEASWGILEVSAPQRNWDTDESGRVQWTQDTLDYFMAGGGMAGGKAPIICLMWEAPSGVNWVQGHGYNDARSLDARWVGGTIPYSAAKAQNSPLWAVWRPYITGTPRGA